MQIIPEQDTTQEQGHIFSNRKVMSANQNVRFQTIFLQCIHVNIGLPCLLGQHKILGKNLLQFL